MKSYIKRVLNTLVTEIGERPTGTATNDEANHFLGRCFREMGYLVNDIHFDCVCWERGSAVLNTSQGEVPIYVGPFSESIRGSFPIEIIETIDELETSSLTGKLLVLAEEIAKQPLMPKEFPFFFPDDHNRIITALESKRPEAVIAVTGKHPFCGLNPFPLFNDGSITIPNAYMNQKTLKAFVKNELKLNVHIESGRSSSTGRQIIASTKERKKGKVMLCAHMDTAYDTPGALDNAAGVAVLLEVASKLADYSGPYELEFVPFNGEEYFGVSGQLAYLNDIGSKIEDVVRVFNFDGLGFIHSNTALSFYNVNSADQHLIQTNMSRSPFIEKGPQWIAGDHSIFAFRNIPTIAVTSSDLLGKVMNLTHTPLDTIHNVDQSLLQETATFIADLIMGME